MSSQAPAFGELEPRCRMTKWLVNISRASAIPVRVTKAGMQRHLEDFRPRTHQSATISTLRNYVEARATVASGGMPAMQFHDSPSEAIETIGPGSKIPTVPQPDYN